MAERKAKPDVRVYVSFEESPDYGDGSRFAHIYAQPMALARGKYGDRKMELWDTDSYEIDMPEGGAAAALRSIARVRVTSQASSGDTEAQLYGWAVEYVPRGGTVDLRDAERVLPALRRIDGAMRKLNERFGYPRDLASYLAYFADAVTPGTVRTVIPFLRRLREGEPDFEGTGYRAMDSVQLGGWIDETLKEWRKRVS